MIEKFRSIKLNKTNIERLGIINEIIKEYQDDGYVLTLRQLYYQLVSRDIIPNKQAEYSKLSTLLKEGRMGGIVDWGAIEDRLRKPSKPSEFDSAADILDAAINQFRLPRQKGQKVYIEVWVEKDALSGVLKKVTNKFGINIMVNRGYSSASAMYDSYQRFTEAINEGQKALILYLGDFDPSGIDMIRDIDSRIKEFLVAGLDFVERFETLDNDTMNEYIYPYHDQGLGTLDCIEFATSDYAEVFVNENFLVIPIALTKKQIKEYNPPPNPTKITDPRAKDFILAHGDTSWEVDALRPDVLNRVLTDAIENIIDITKYEDIIKQEKTGKKILREIKTKL